MSDPQCELVLQAFFAALQATPIASLSVARNRDTEVTSYPSLVMVDGGQSVDMSNSAFTRYDMEVTVEGYVVADTTDEVGAACNALYAAMLREVMRDITLGGVSFDIEEGKMEKQLDRSEGGKPCLAFSVPFTITYFTAVHDPYLAG